MVTTFDPSLRRRIAAPILVQSGTSHSEIIAEISPGRVGERGVCSSPSGGCADSEGRRQGLLVCRGFANRQTTPPHTRIRDRGSRGVLTPTLTPTVLNRAQFRAPRRPSLSSVSGLILDALEKRVVKQVLPRVKTFDLKGGRDPIRRTTMMWGVTPQRRSRWLDGGVGSSLTNTRLRWSPWCARPGKASQQSAATST